MKIERPNKLAQWQAQLNHAKAQEQFSRALAGVGLTAERFAFTAYMAAARTPKLLEAPQSQLWLGVYAAAECGLSLQPHLQHMHLVPYLGREATVQPIIGYQGLAYLTAKASLGLLGDPVIVFQRDIDEGRFRYSQGTSERCSLDPIVKNPTRPRGVVRYAFVTYTSNAGVTKFCCIDRDELLARREKSAGWQAFKAGKRKTSPWSPDVDKDGSESGDFLAMCKKSTVRAFKTLPKSADHWGERAAKAETIDADVVALRDVLDVPEEAIPEDVETVAPETPVVHTEPKPEVRRPIIEDESTADDYGLRVDAWLKDLAQATLDDLDGMFTGIPPGARAEECKRAWNARRASLTSGGGR